MIFGECCLKSRVSLAVLANATSLGVASCHLHYLGSNTVAGVWEPVSSKQQRPRTSTDRDHVEKQPKVHRQGSGDYDWEAVAKPLTRSALSDAASEALFICWLIVVGLHYWKGALAFLLPASCWCSCMWRTAELCSCQPATDIPGCYSVFPATCTDERSRGFPAASSAWPPCNGDFIDTSCETVFMATPGTPLQDDSHSVTSHMYDPMLHTSITSSPPWPCTLIECLAQ